MPRYFNTAGPCRPELHYMLPPLRRLGNLERLIEQQQYFVLHAPRQTGKTTSIQALVQKLNELGGYAVLYLNVEDAQVAGEDVAQGMATILSKIELEASLQLTEDCRPELPATLETPTTVLERTLGAWAAKCPRTTVLFIDEIDALQDETLLSTLRQLRSGYVRRPRHFPQSVALIGLRDVRDYKIRTGVRPDAHSLGTASPFNIKAKSLLLRNFTREEVAELYLQHTAETGQRFTDETLQKAFDLTQGQPWLVNALAAEVVEEIVPDPVLPVTVDHLEQARENLIQRRDTHLDSLVDKLHEERVRRIIEAILIGDILPADVLNDDLEYTRDLGLVETAGGPVRIANPIYAEIIPRALSWTMQASVGHETAWYVRADGSLDLPALLRAFQAFYRQNSEAWLSRFDFQEAGPHLMLMAFLQRLVNAGGTVQREFAIGSGRADVVVRWGKHGSVVELKIRYSNETEAQGIAQLAQYLERMGMTEGYLFIFDRRREVSWDEKIYDRIVSHDGKQIHVFGA